MDADTRYDLLVDLDVGTSVRALDVGMVVVKSYPSTEGCWVVIVTGVGENGFHWQSDPVSAKEAAAIASEIKSRVNREIQSAALRAASID